MTGEIVHLEARQNPTQLAIKLTLRIYAKLTVMMDLRVKGCGRVLGEIVHIAVKPNLMIDIKNSGYSWNKSNHFNK